MNPTLKTVLLIFAHIILLPLVALEYFIAFWFWAGDGFFNLVAVPCLFGLFLFLQLFILFRSKTKITKIGLTYTSICLTPIIAVLLTSLIAMIFGISINIM